MTDDADVLDLEEVADELAEEVEELDVDVLDVVVAVV